MASRGWWHRTIAVLQIFRITGVLDGVTTEKALALKRVLERTDEEISRRMPEAALACQIAPCHD
jgi:hypothetical protein